MNIYQVPGRELLGMTNISFVDLLYRCDDGGELYENWSWPARVENWNSSEAPAHCPVTLILSFIPFLSLCFTVVPSIIPSLSITCIKFCTYIIITDSTHFCPLLNYDQAAKKSHSRSKAYWVENIQADIIFRFPGKELNFMDVVFFHHAHNQNNICRPTQCITSLFLLKKSTHHIILNKIEKPRSYLKWCFEFRLNCLFFCILLTEHGEAAWSRYSRNFNMSKIMVSLQKSSRYAPNFTTKKLIVYFTVASQWCKESLFYMILNKKLA